MPSKRILENVLCDRDGTVIYDKHYLADPDGVALLLGAAKGLFRLAQRGVRLFVVTNQSGIGRGMFSLEDYQACSARLGKILDQAGVTLADSAFCPHAPEESCFCRKPRTGMWDELDKKHGLVPGRSVMIGDKPEDVLFGKNAGLAASVLVLTGKGADSAEKLGLPRLPEGKTFLRIPGDRPEQPDALAVNLAGAVDYLESAFQFPLPG